jgi:mono/diheme cytochrome c family protein
LIWVVAAVAKQYSKAMSFRSALFSPRRLLLRWAPLLAGAALVALAATWRPAIAPIRPPERNAFSSVQVTRGATLAKIGDCSVCHTADGGHSFAGGRPLATPFGTLYSNNITPDTKTGIGNWSLAAFMRAMRDGVARDGAHLYPALPYEHFTHVTDDDLAALYAFFMTRRPVAATPPANRLIFPLGFRPLLAGWKLLFLRKGPIAVDPRQTAEWNRGAYLAEGLGHCAACHSPRNLLGGEERGGAYAGGVAEGWRAPPLNASNPAAGRWTAEALYTFLRTGTAPDHSAAAGPMGPVIESLSNAPEADVRAISVYIASKMGGGSALPTDPAIDNEMVASRQFPQGATLFAGACAGCHGTGAPMAAQGRPSLGLSSDVRDTDPTSAIQAVLQGIAPPVAGRGPMMPSFGASLTDNQVAQVLGYVRARYTDRPAWRKLPKAVQRARKEGAQP